MIDAPDGRPDSSGQGLRTASLGGAGFAVAYLVHRILQGLGPDGSGEAAVTQYIVDNRGALRASEVVLGFGLLSFIVFAAALVPVVWRSGEQAPAVAIGIGSAAFVAMGLTSTAVETALYALAADPASGSVVILDQLQGRVPVVWTITAVVAAVSLAVRRTGWGWPWLGPAGLVAAGVFLLGSIFSLLGPTAEDRGSLVGVGLFIAWMAVISAALWRVRSPA